MIEKTWKKECGDQTSPVSSKPKSRKGRHYLETETDQEPREVR